MLAQVPNSVTDDRGVFRKLSNIKDGAFLEYSQRLLAVDYFCKTLHLRC